VLKTILDKIKNIKKRERHTHSELPFFALLFGHYGRKTSILGMSKAPCQYVPFANPTSKSHLLRHPLTNLFFFLNANFQNLPWHFILLPLFKSTSFLNYPPL